MLDWDTVRQHALSLAGAEPGTHFGKPTIKANGHALISPGRESGSFVLHIDQGSKMMLMETDPSTYWQTQHYEGWPAVLVRYDSADPERILAMIEKARDWALTRKRNPKTRRSR